MAKQAQALELMLPKGMRDLSPEEKLLQQHVLKTLQEVFELYGYSPLETPAVERMEVLTAKFAVGEGTDVSHEIFKVSDQADRNLGLRFDMTVPLCRYVAMHPTIKLPFKRYVMGKVFRDGPIKLGRYREFWQADADIVGVPGILADSEGVLIAQEVFKRLGLDVTIVFGSRELLHELMDTINIPKNLRSKALIALDKLKKIGKKEVIDDMKDAGIPVKKATELLSLTELSGSNQKKMKHLQKFLKKSTALDRLVEIAETLQDLKNFIFDPSLCRGLAYYTGFFFECFLNNSSITSSLVGTGRYDKMIGQFLGTGQEIPAVGISFGVSVICDALEEKGYKKIKTLTSVYVVPVTKKDRSMAFSVTEDLREAGIKTDMDLLERSIGKNFAYADALQIPYVVVIGEEERKAKKVTVKDMRTGKQERITVENLKKKLA